MWRHLAFVLATAVVVLEAPVLLGGRTWDDVPYQAEIAPPRLAAADAVLHREVPAWWDGSGLGVPLLAEPSHGAAYPLVWIAATPRLLDALWIVHLWWCALGVALWARRQQASQLGALVAGVLVVTSGVLASAAIRGALPALAHVPWIALCADQIATRKLRRVRVRAAIAMAALLGLVALAGQLVVLLAAIALALVRPRTWIALAVVAGLAIGAVQWLPALLVDGVGASLHRLPLARLPELLVPGTHTGWFPSLAIGAPLLALAKPRPLHVLVLGALVVLAFIVPGGDVLVAMIAIVAAMNAARGIDALLAKDRRTLVTVAGAAAVTALALAIERSPRALVDVGCLLAAAAIAWRVPPTTSLRSLAIVVLVVAPTVIAQPLIAPTTARHDDMPLWARHAHGPVPTRVYRPPVLFDAPAGLETALATLAGTSAARFGIATAQSADPARPRAHDRVWLAAASMGGELFARFGIALAILPAREGALATRGSWSLVKVPAAPIAALVYEWVWVDDEHTALARLFPPGAGRGLATGMIVLRGQGADQQDEPSPPEPCTIEAWRPGAIDLVCDARAPAYAVLSVTPVAGWHVRVDGSDTFFQIADVMRLAVPVERGHHRIEWRFSTPAFTEGLMTAALAIAGLIALLFTYGAHRVTSAEND